MRPNNKNIQPADALGANKIISWKEIRLNEKKSFFACIPLSKARKSKQNVVFDFIQVLSFIEINMLLY